ncbi:hypothetical protein FCZ17_26965 [Escherichia coli]|nr:hypothetical protein [Escherichia coli]
MFQTKQCVQQCLMKTLIGLFMKTRVCLVKHLVENTCITLTEMLSKIRVYSIIPTLATFSDTHAD